MRLQDYDVTRRYRATVVASSRLTPASSAEEVRELVLRLDDADFQFEPGQNIGVLVPGPHAFGQDYHFRLYSIANAPGNEKPVTVTIAVRRCSYIDDYSGELYRGVASNYLCDLAPQAELLITGPYGLAFAVPADKHAELVLVGMGTGIAPFRAFVKHLYQHCPNWQGRILLLYGGHSGLEMAYMNDERDDFALYYDKDTFAAVKALSARPHRKDPADMNEALRRHAKLLWEKLRSPHTCVYIAGLASIRDTLDKVFSGLAGSGQAWRSRKADLEAAGRWVELVY